MSVLFSVTDEGIGVNFRGSRMGKDRQRLMALLADYDKYKDHYQNNIEFDPSYDNLSKLVL